MRSALPQVGRACPCFWLRRVIEGGDILTDREMRRPLNGAENAKLARLYGDGTIRQATRQRLQRGLDLEAARLSNEQH